MFGWRHKKKFLIKCFFVKECLRKLIDVVIYILKTLLIAFYIFVSLLIYDLN